MIRAIARHTREVFCVKVMNLVEYFNPQLPAAEIPLRLKNPFDNNPHPLAILATEDLRQKLSSNTRLSDQLPIAGNGKMFGVLVVVDAEGKTGYLAGFSGMLDRQWIVPGFVPPVFDVEDQQAFLATGEATVKALSAKIGHLSSHPSRLKAQCYLVDLARRKQQRLAVLKQLNVNNRQQRKFKRLGLDIKRDEEQLVELSLQSQRDKRNYKRARSTWEARLHRAQAQFGQNYDNEINALKRNRKRLSQQLHNRVFETCQLINSLGETIVLKSLFDGKVPPGGSGDCAAPKLLQYAHRHGLRPLALAEFWWGAPPATGVRHHGHFYPPCRGKCHPILPYMLKGIDIDPGLSSAVAERLVPEIVYQDADIVVVNKPAGLLSIPGKQQQYSVLSWLKQRFTDATGALLVHRLDMATSGLLLAAKNSHAHKQLQQQFIKRRIRKRYVAILSKPVAVKNMTIDLPLRVDLEDRPRQMVCYQHGKPAITRMRVISTDSHSTRVYFYPHTGRTHQLRVHAAHSRGIAAPILGDALYGTRSGRLMLHAERLGFQHPATGERVEFRVRAPF